MSNSTAIALLQRYNFELGDRSLEDLCWDWYQYDPTWVHMAVVECLYRGRYKAISVSQILQSWHRRQAPYCQFNHEFESLVCTMNNSVESHDDENHPAYAPSSTLIAKLKSLCQNPIAI